MELTESEKQYVVNQNRVRELKQQKKKLQDDARAATKVKYDEANAINLKMTNDVAEIEAQIKAIE